MIGGRVTASLCDGRCCTAGWLGRDVAGRWVGVTGGQYVEPPLPPNTGVFKTGTLRVGRET